MNVKPRGLVAVNIKNLESDEFYFIISQFNQRLWAAKSIDERCKLFHRTFPDRRISVPMMRRIMSMANIVKKRIIVSTAPARRDERTEEFKDSIIELDLKLHQISKEGGHIVYTDETVFKSRDFQRKAYSMPYQNIHISDRTGKQPC